MAIMRSETVRIRMPWQGFLLPLVSLAISSVGLTINAWASPLDAGPRTAMRVLWIVAVVFAVVVVAYTVARGPGIDLRDDAAVVVTPFRRDQIPWGDVQAGGVRQARPAHAVPRGPHRGGVRVSEAGRAVRPVGARERRLPPRRPVVAGASRPGLATAVSAAAPAVPGGGLLARHRTAPGGGDLAHAARGATMSADVVRVLAPRRLLLRRVPYVVCVALLTAVTWGPDTAADRDAWMVAGWTFCLVVAVVMTALELGRRDGLELRSDTVVVLRSFRPREVAWRDVQAITPGRWPDRSTTLHLASGATVPCGYPRLSPLVPRRRVEADYHRVGRWWLAHRGPDWRPLFAQPPAPYPAAASWPVAAPHPVEEVWRTPPEARRQ